MPVTKTAKRALRASKRKEVINKLIAKQLEIVIRFAKKTKTKESILKAISLVDRAAKKKVFHKNKTARIKSTLSKLLPRRVKGPKGPGTKQRVIKSTKKSVSLKPSKKN